MNSSLYTGTVTHSRVDPFRHRFRYRVFYGLFDVDELDDIDDRLRLMSVDRPNLFSIYSKDYGADDGTPLRRWAEDAFAHAGVDVSKGHISLLAFPRILGYVFNPLAVWYGHNSEGRLVGVIHEVRNTFGDKHSYVVPVDENGFRHGFDKLLHVSPFNGMDQDYRFTISEPGERISVSIDTREEGGVVMRAGMALTEMPLTDSNLWRMFWTHPLLTAKVIGAIHWQALRIWLKGGTFHSRPQPADHNLTVVDPRSALA